MNIIISILSLFVFLKTLYYGIYEVQQNNKVAGVSIIILSAICLVIPIVLQVFRINIGW